MFNQFRTALLLGLLGGLFLLVGGLLGGQQGLIIALVFAIVMNFGAYWYSDKLVLKIYRARELEVKEYAHVHRLVNVLAKKANLPKPKLYLIPSHNPNAFAGKKHSKETKKYLSEKANIGCVIVFLDGKETHVKNKISIGPVIGKSVSYGMKLTNEYNHLLKQNGIKEIRIL